MGGSFLSFDRKAFQHLYFFDTDSIALSQVQAFSAPHFLFLWRVKEKENAPLAVEKKKKAFRELADGSVKKINCGTCVSAECLSI